MAGADYYSCDVCGTKTFYDAHVEYWRVGKMVCICEECFKSHDVVIVDCPKPKEPATDK